MTAAFARSAKPALAAELDPLIANAQGYDGLLSLKRAPDAHKELFAAVTPDERSQYQNRINIKFNAILTGLINEEKANLAKIGSGASGLKQGAEWYYAFQARYLREFNGPEVEAVSQAFHAKRRSQLLAVEPELTRMIRQARNEDEIDKLLREYLSLPGDESVPGIDKLVQAAASRKQQLHRNDVLGTQAANRSSRRGARQQSGPSATRKGDVSFGAYNLPGILGPLYSGNFDKIADDQITRNYVLSVAVGFNKKCPAYANDTSAAPPVISQYAMYFETKNLRAGVNAAIGGNYDKSLQHLLDAGNGGLGRGAGMAAAASHLLKEGVADGELFIDNHRCDGLPTRHLHDNIYKLAFKRGDSPPEFDNVDHFKAQMNLTLQQEYGYTGPKPPSLAETVANKCILQHTEQIMAGGEAGTSSKEERVRESAFFCRCHIQSMVIGGVPDSVLQSLDKFDDYEFGDLAKRYPGYYRVRSENCYK